DYLVDEVPKVKHKPQLAVSRRPFIFPDHPAEGILGALVDALARHEGKSNRARIGDQRSRNGATDAATRTAIVSESIPVGRRWREAANQRSAGPIGRFQNWHSHVG